MPRNTAYPIRTIYCKSSELWAWVLSYAQAENMNVSEVIEFALRRLMFDASHKTRK